MYRSFSNRIFAGVCGGIANTLPLNAWIWRLIFIALTLLTMGVGAIVYLLMWWILPLDSPLRSREGGSIPGIISILLAIILPGLWFARNTLNLSESYWGIAFLIVAIVFLLKQIFTGRLQNITFGLVAIAIPIVFLLQQYDVLQAGAIDILIRAAPAVLVFFGLSIALRYRVRFGTWIALLVSIALVAGLATFAFSSRVDVVSTDNLIEASIPNEDEHDLSAISDNITTLLLTVSSRDTDVTITVSDIPRVIQAEFLGSNNSAFDIAYSEDGAIAVAEIIEGREAEFPLLENIGRGDLLVQIPPDIAVGLVFRGGHSDIATLDMGELNLERLTFTLEEGDVLVRLPLYQPLSPSVVDSNGEWTVQQGDLRVIAPVELGVRFAFDQNTQTQPSNYDDLIYRLEVARDDYLLESRQYDNLEETMQFGINISGGSFRLENDQN